ncbi:MAG: sulfotransferase [Rhodanobacteraceae bacterium]
MTIAPVDRLDGLPPGVRELALAIEHALERGAFADAEARLEKALTAAPGHAELLRLCGLSELFNGRTENAIALLQKSMAARPVDALVVANLGTALAQRGDVDAAERAFRRATELDPMFVDAWFNLGRALDLRHDAAAAHDAFAAVLELAPSHQPARILRAEALKTLGRVSEAETALRAVLRENPSSVAASVALANLKPARAEDVEALARLHRESSLSAAERIDVEFALGQALEASGRFDEAFAMLQAANAAKRATFGWDATRVSALVDEILDAFARADLARDARGGDIVFLVGMPRSGSTLAEQILAAHPSVTGGGETGWLAGVLQAESIRRGVPFPAWVGATSPDDWARVGDEYLARVDRARKPGTRFTDKTLTNWQTLGAIRRMLPGARVVHCRRDPLETAWSCYKHNFASEQFWSYDVDELAAFFADCERAMRTWNARFPAWIHAHAHEALLADPERATRALLAACGLPFDPACLRFQDADREVRTASAAQVRAPLRADAQVARRYGASLDGLRTALADRGIAVS